MKFFLTVLFFVFLPVGWFIYQMIRYTAKSLGDESPLAIVITYKIDEWDYFTGFNFLFLVFYTGISVLLLYTSIFFMIPASKLYWHWLISFVTLIISLFSLSVMSMLFLLNWQYWLITRGKTITLDPTDQSLEISTFEETIHITDANVQEIEQHTPGPSSGKMVAGYTYLIFRLKNGRAVYLNLNKSYLDFALAEYFKNVPVRRIPHKIPWIVPA